MAPEVLEDVDERVADLGGCRELAAVMPVCPDLALASEELVQPAREAGDAASADYSAQISPFDPSIVTIAPFSRTTSGTPLEESRQTVRLFVM